jgi:hypothetical protein
MRSIERPPSFRALGLVISIVAAIAFIWGMNYTLSGPNSAFASLPGNQDSTCQIAQICKFVGGPFLLIGLLTLLIGISRDRKSNLKD